jgi:hypothetical protein
VWDLRNLTKGAVAEVTKLPNYFAQTDCIFSPDERYIVTGKEQPLERNNHQLAFFFFFFLLQEQALKTQKMRKEVDC